jgi:gliding motility-associated-like protein
MPVKFKIYITFIILFGLSGLVSAQDNIPPERPYITHVSVDTANNNSLLYWTMSPSSDVEWYLIYYEIQSANGLEGVKFDSVSANQNSYVHVGGGAEKGKILYSVTALDSSKNESLRKPGLHSTLHTSLFYDSCINKIRVQWNKYIGWDNNVSGYRLFYKAPGGSFELLSGVGYADSTYDHYNIEENKQYEYFIEAVKNDGLVSRSNISRKYTYMPASPPILSLDYVTVKEKNKIDISYVFSDTSEINDFVLMRSANPLADFIIIGQANNVNTSPSLFQDEIITSVDQYYYKIGALNSCNRVIGKSNYGVNLLLVADTANHNVNLSWNEYKEWSAGVQEYRVYRNDQDGNFNLIATTNSLSYTDDLTAIYNTGLDGEIRYFVVAIRSGDEISSSSNILVVRVATLIKIPNAFTPNSDGKNDSFKPLLSFYPADFLMLIYDRTGNIIFKTENFSEGWDGSVNGSNMAPQGVYMYHIQFTSKNGTKLKKTGNLTLFYP